MVIGRSKDIEELLDVEVKLRKIKQEKAIRERQQCRDIVCEVHEVSPRFPYPQGPREYQKTAFENWKNNKQKGLFAMATGTGKTFTIANVIEKVGKPTLVLAHNKTLAGQLYAEFKELFPNNHVEYFVSYYDYYQPEAYIPTTDTYIEKDSAVNDEIDKLRHSATSALSERRDVIIVASVSCIYTLGDPIDYRSMVISLRPGMEKSREALIDKLIEIQYDRNDVSFTRNKFRVRGDVVEVFPAYSNENAFRIAFKRIMGCSPTTFFKAHKEGNHEK